MNNEYEMRFYSIFVIDTHPDERHLNRKSMLNTMLSEE